MHNERDGESTMQLYKAGNNELVHVALRLRSDILAQPCHKGLDISEDAVVACIPDILVLGGQSVFDFDTDVDDSIEQYKNTKVQNIILSLAHA